MWVVIQKRSAFSMPTTPQAAPSCGGAPPTPQTSPYGSVKKRRIIMEIELQTEAEDFVKASEVQAVLGNVISHYERRQQLLLAVMQEPEVKAAIQVMLARHAAAAKKNAIN